RGLVLWLLVGIGASRSVALRSQEKALADSTGLAKPARNRPVLSVFLQASAMFNSGLLDINWPGYCHEPPRGAHCQTM
ncbi:hypothetical protein, partial [Aminobacter sp. LjRoot7]|uniref:hypothetical protein n=1 Tax=Aminobacter sp. LjRoot7 TaxID=3342335 RepID=UPI003F50CD89